jgi:hypothetical protein
MIAPWGRWGEASERGAASTARCWSGLVASRCRRVIGDAGAERARNLRGESRGGNPESRGAANGRGSPARKSNGTFTPMGPGATARSVDGASVCDGRRSRAQPFTHAGDAAHHLPGKRVRSDVRARVISRFPIVWALDKRHGRSACKKVLRAGSSTKPRIDLVNGSTWSESECSEKRRQIESLLPLDLFRAPRLPSQKLVLRSWVVGVGGGDGRVASSLGARA